ncbi:myb-like protein X [Pecten maximus]|uniref:myb-like protein X n=1 Tax=Pecten maximus TaxID=6579 RepID=UPI001457EE2C|nr:myb-like protein X [Pecten maximus]
MAAHSGFGYRCNDCLQVYSREGKHKKCTSSGFTIIKRMTMTFTELEDEEYRMYASRATSLIKSIRREAFTKAEETESIRDSYLLKRKETGRKDNNDQGKRNLKRKWCEEDNIDRKERNEEGKKEKTDYMDTERKEDENKENDADKERKQIRPKEGKKIDTERKEIGQKEGKKMDTERKEIGKRAGKEINSDKKEIKEVEKVWYARKPTQPARPYNKKLKSITQKPVVNAKEDAEKTQPTNVDKRRSWLPGSQMLDQLGLNMSDSDSDSDEENDVVEIHVSTDEEDIDDQQDINNNGRGQSPEDKDVDIAKDDDSRSVSVRLITDKDMEKKAKSDRQDTTKTIITITPQYIPTDKNTIKLRKMMEMQQKRVIINIGGKKLKLVYRL